MNLLLVLSRVTVATPTPAAAWRTPAVLPVLTPMLTSAKNGLFGVADRTRSCGAAPDVRATV